MGGVVLILLDSLMNFRLEYLYPIIMFMRSVYDSYKYQGFVSGFKKKPNRKGHFWDKIHDLLLHTILDIFSAVHLFGDLSGSSLLDCVDCALALSGSQHVCVAGNRQDNW